MPAQPQPEEPEPVAVPPELQRSGPARWVVVLVASAVTVILAAGGYLIYQNFFTQ